MGRCAQGLLPPQRDAQAAAGGEQARAGSTSVDTVQASVQPSASPAATPPHPHPHTQPPTPAAGRVPRLAAKPSFPDPGRQPQRGGCSTAGSGDRQAGCGGREDTAVVVDARPAWACCWDNEGLAGQRAWPAFAAIWNIIKCHLSPPRARLMMRLLALPAGIPFRLLTVQDLTLAQLQSLHLGGRAGLKVPSLQQFLE